MAKSGKSVSKKDAPKALNGGSEAPIATVDLPVKDEGAAAPASGPSAARTATQPQLKILGQYLKDLSFENPNAPQSLGAAVGAAGDRHFGQRECRPLAAHDIEVEIHLEAKASRPTRSSLQRSCSMPAYSGWKTSRRRCCSRWC